MRSEVRAAIATGALACVAACVAGRSTAAAMPRLTFPCSAPTAEAIVTCRLKGMGFAPHEHVSIAYRIVIRTAAGRDKVTVYRRTAMTDSTGAFRRPPLTFRVDPAALAYTASVEAVGARHDRAAIATTGVP